MAQYTSYPQEDQQQQQQQETQQPSAQQACTVLGHSLSSSANISGIKRSFPEELQSSAALSSSHPNKQHRKVLTMHPSNIYAAGSPNFMALAAQHPPLLQYLIPGNAPGSSNPWSTIDFTSWAATKELTAALLKCDFGVIWDLPEGQLVPPVPNRANYIHWVADLLQLSSPKGITCGTAA